MTLRGFVISEAFSRNHSPSFMLHRFSILLLKMPNRPLRRFPLSFDDSLPFPSLINPKPVHWGPAVHQTSAVAGRTDPVVGTGEIASASSRADFEFGHFYCELVYKVDLLSRSLLDFARIKDKKQAAPMQKQVGRAPSGGIRGRQPHRFQRRRDSDSLVERQDRLYPVGAL